MNNVTAVTAPATATTAVAPVTVGRGGASPQVVQVKQEPAPPGNVATPKASSTVIRRGKGEVKRPLPLVLQKLCQRKMNTL